MVVLFILLIWFTTSIPYLVMLLVFLNLTLYLKLPYLMSTILCTFDAYKYSYVNYVTL